MNQDFLNAKIKFVHAYSKMVVVPIQIQITIQKK